MLGRVTHAAGGLVKTARLACFAAVLSAAAVVGSAAVHFGPPTPLHIADANDSAIVLRGRRIYSDHCASCHGRYLQGQPLWQLIDDYARRRAPAHDETGHTWQHPDEDIFDMTKYGRFASAPSRDVSYMPAFREKLSDRDILATIAFIKARWPRGLRVAQATLNPGHAGMPPEADRVDWKFPPACKGVLRQGNISDQPDGR
jgi:mono/diheme cytochrome c family protein